MANHGKTADLIEKHQRAERRCKVLEGRYGAFAAFMRKDDIEEILLKRAERDETALQYMTAYYTQKGLI